MKTFIKIFFQVELFFFILGCGKNDDHTVIDKVFEGNIDLATQKVVGGFGAENYTHILGTMTIGLKSPSETPSIIDNLSALKNLKAVDELLISRNRLLTNLKGLENLTLVGSLNITNNESLQNIEGLKNLSSVNTLSIYSSHSLTTTIGIHNLIFADYINIRNCRLLQNLDDFSKIKRPSVSLTLIDVPNLKSIDGLKNLEFVNYLEFKRTGLTTLGAFKNLLGTNKFRLIHNIELKTLGDMKSFANIGNLLFWSAILFSRI